MSFRDREKRLRALETFGGARLVPGAWTVVRLDGRGFSRLTAERFEKPFDPRFRDLMVATARAVLEEFGGVFAHTQSDEASVLFPRDWALYDRRAEKIASVAAGLASAVFSVAGGAVGVFDARLWTGVTDDDVVDYFRWRQEDGARNALNGRAYWALRAEGRGAANATRTLAGATRPFKHELLFARGVNFAATPAWERRGVGLWWETVEKEGVDPRTGETARATRRRVRTEAELPAGDAYGALLRGLLAGR